MVSKITTFFIPVKNGIHEELGWSCFQKHFTKQSYFPILLQYDVRVLVLVPIFTLIRFVVETNLYNDLLKVQVKI